MDLKRDSSGAGREWQKLAKEYPLKYRWMEREKKSKNVDATHANNIRSGYITSATWTSLSK